MTQQAIINATVQMLNQLPLSKAEEVSTFAQFLLKRHEEEMLTKGIQKLTEENPSFSFLNEDEDVYTLNDIKSHTMDKGDIILTPFPFSDLTGSKLRPAVVLAEAAKDFLVCFITSQTQWQEATEIYLTPSTQNGLKFPSLIRTNKIASIQKTLVLGKFGKLSVTEIDLLNKNLKLVLQLP